MLAIRKILHPTDYSELSRPAFELACALARDFDAELVICHVSLPPIIAAGEGAIVNVPIGETEELMAQLEQVKPAERQIRVGHKLLQGDPASEIIWLANDIKPDLIVMGTHGRSGFGRLLMGSVSEEVMRKAPCPVVTVKAPIPANQQPASMVATAESEAGHWDD